MDSLSGVGVLDKAMTVLGALRDGARTLADLQQATGLPRATAHRLAVALEVHGMVRRDEDGRFTLGFALLEFGRAAGVAFPLGEIARPVLEQLRQDTAEGVQFYVREGEHRRCVLSLPAPHALQWIVPEGVLLPLDRGSAGRALTAGERRAVESTSNRPPWFESVEEREKGVASVSAPVWGAQGVVVAAVSVSGPLERLTRSPGRRFGDSVSEAAERISRSLSS